LCPKQCLSNIVCGSWFVRHLGACHTRPLLWPFVMDLPQESLDSKQAQTFSTSFRPQELSSDVSAPPRMSRQRSNSVSSPTATEIQPNAILCEHLAPEPLYRQRSNSAGAARAPNPFEDKLPDTPRAARHETLEWEELGGRGPERGENECIHVAARFRPLDQEELELGGDMAVRFGNDGKSCTVVAGEKITDFCYDNIFRPEATQTDVYVTVAQPIVDGIINGFNGAILAYGQTGSGKTHTMLGPDGAQGLMHDEIDMDLLGIIPRALQALLDYAAPTEGQVQLRASYVEVYQEHIIDLLSPCRGGASIREQTCTNALYLPEVTQTPISSVREAMEVMRTGNRNRHMAETQMNRHSSRSHAVFIVTVTNSVDRARQKFAQLYLVDLAGSERVLKTCVRGQQLEEAKQINKSLLALGQVIWALAHKQKHIPYRDSKLTRLLQNCLGGNARTAILIAASPHERNINESVSALRFGARASLVENIARVNIAEDPRELKRLLTKAREDLSELRSHCRRLQSTIAACRVAESLPMGKDGGVDREQLPTAPLQALTAKRLLVWGLLPALVCPLKRAVMRDPVCAADGWTYERMAVERHFTRAGRCLPLSPVTGQRMSSRQLMPNLVVKQLVRQHLPDLASPEVRLPMVALLPVWLVQEILFFLDARSLAKCEVAWPSFLAASDASQTWTRLLGLDFDASQNDSAASEGTNTVGTAAGHGMDHVGVGTTVHSSGRVRYAALARTGRTGGAGARPVIAPKSKGLQLLRQSPP